LNDDRLLHAALQDAADTRQVVIGSGVLASVVDVFRQSFDDRSAVIVADENTLEVAGREVQRQLFAARFNPIGQINFPRARLKASYAQAWQIRSRYTIFDLAAEAGGLSKCVENLFAPGGFWFEA
jgi:hypothetical protein